MRKFVKFLIFNLLIVNLGIVFAIGRQDIVGYTTYDWQMGGPMSSRCRTAAVCNGIHVCWIGSNFNPLTDRNMGYNYYNFTTRQWHYPAGLNIYSQRSGFGNLDYDPITGVAVAITQQSIGGNITLVAAKDASPGAGIFSYCTGPAGYSDATINVSNNQAIHCATIKSFNDSLFYVRVQPWCSWSTPVNICGTAPQPGHHWQAIAASKISNKVLVAWQCSYDPYPQRAFYRISNDGGLTWDLPVQLPFPPAQGMTPTFHISSLFAMLDNQDNLHIIASVSDTGRTVPAAIWHFCPVNNPQWGLVYHYAPQTVAAPIGYNAIHATRPTIVQSPTTNYFYACWEQFDSLNYEPTTYLARADIWIAESHNNGQTWHNQRRITPPNTTSKRFPCAGGVFADTLVVSYIIDSIAGFDIMMQGRSTRNPVICHFIPLPYAGIEEGSMFQVSSFTLQVSPNPFNSFSVIRYSTPNVNKVSLEIYDVTGRLIKSFSHNQQLKTNNSVVWDGKDNHKREVKPGIYFCTVKTTDKTITQKLLKTK